MGIHIYYQTYTEESKIPKLSLISSQIRCHLRALSRIQLWRHDYMVEGYESGGYLLKVLTRECSLDTNAAVMNIRTTLMKLDEYIVENGTDLRAFEVYVRSQRDAL